MKNLFASALMIGLSVSCFAQSSKVQNAYIYMNDNDLVKARTEIDLAVAHEKTIGDAKAWFYRGEIYEMIYTNSFVENEKTKELIYPQYVPLRPGAIDKAVESYEKALSIGGNRVDPNEVKQHHRDMSRLAYQEGVLMYNDKNWPKAGAYFAMAYTIREQYKSPTGEGSDLESAYNAAIAFRQAAMMSESEKYLRICIANNFKAEDSYIELARLYESTDKEKFKSILSEARVKFPNNQDIITAEINIYIDAKEYDKAKANLDAAIKNDPQNAVLYFVRGTLLDNEQRELFEKKNIEAGQKAFDAATLDYKKTAELKPDHFEANYSIGAMYYNRGAEMINEAASIADDAKYKIAKTKAEDQLKAALPYLEKAHELNPTDTSTMASLKELYARTNQMDKYNAMNEKLKN